MKIEDYDRIKIRKQDSYQTMYISSDNTQKTLFDQTQDKHEQQQGFHPNIMDTSQAPFDSAQVFDPNMTYTSHGVVH